MTQLLDNDTFRMRLRMTGIIWFAMLISIGLYALIVEAMEREWIGGSPASAIVHGDRIHLLLLAFAVMSFFLAGALKTLVLRSEPVDREDAAAKLQRSTVLALAVSESIAIIGLVEYVLLRRYGSFYLFVALACLSFIIHAPKIDSWEQYASRATSHPDVSD